jgi:hypothetical protein
LQLPSALIHEHILYVSKKVDVMNGFQISCSPVTETEVMPIYNIGSGQQEMGFQANDYPSKSSLGDQLNRKNGRKVRYLICSSRTSNLPVDYIRGRVSRE